MGLEVVEINPKGSRHGSVIFLHGLGADGHDFADIVPQLNFPETLGVRFVFPHAPIRPVTLNAGYSMRAWFDIHGLDKSSPQDEKGIREIQHSIVQLIENEKTLGIPSNKIVLAGFSQGGAMALHCGLRYAYPLAGILGLSTFLPLIDKVPQELNPANQKTPIMLLHGTEDPVIPLVFAEESYQFLKQLGYPVSFHTYPMQHSVCWEEIADISRWLQRLL